MRVTAVVFGSYPSRLPAGSQGGRAEVEVGEGASVRDLADLLGLPAAARRFVRKDGAQIGLDTLLCEGDAVHFVVPLAGG